MADEAQNQYADVTWGGTSDCSLYVDGVRYYRLGLSDDTVHTFSISGQVGDTDTKYEFRSASSQFVPFEQQMAEWTEKWEAALRGELTPVPVPAIIPADWRFKDREVLARALSLVTRMARGYDWTPDEVDALEAKCKLLGITPS